MYLIVVGAGSLGRSLVGLALDDGHDVAVIEVDQKQADEVAKLYDCRVLSADVASDEILTEAGIDEADALIGTMEDDASNLMAMFLGVEHGVKTLISVVGDYSHEPLFKRLGVHVLVHPEQILARYLYGLVRQPHVKDLIALPAGGELFEVTVEAPSPLVQKTLEEIGQAQLLPPQTLVVALKRGETFQIPSGRTRIEAGDDLTVVSQREVAELDLNVFTG